MKKTASILLALSATFSSLSAQEAQTTKSENTIVENPTAIDNPSSGETIRPLFRPENKFLSIGFGGGINTLKYDPELGDRSPMGGGLVNIDYNIFFGGPWSQKKFGLSFGLGAGVYNSKTIINTCFTSTDKIPVTYFDGTSKIEECELNSELNDWEERQTCIALEAPIGLLYRRYLKGNTTLLAGAGFKLLFPLKTTYRVKTGNRETSGYLGSADMQINSDIPQHGYTTKYDRPRGTTDTKNFSASVYLDMNFVHKATNADFFWGVYGSLGLASISKFSEESIADIDNYCGVLASNAVDATNLNSVGVRLGVKIPFPRLRDNDQDGVYDKFDKCLGTPVGAPVDSCGCPLDSDKDSVPDYLDRCPNTPKGIAVDSVGCPLDADKDGVPDYLDKCPNTPDSVIVDVNGCPLDTDGDGVPDYLDKCSDTPKGMKVDENGCQTDSDGDGVDDENDKCPNTPAGVEVDAKGCPVDTDKDGIPDYLDKCPTVKGTKKNNGCPVVSATAKAVFKQAMHGIQFETNKSVIKKTSYPVLDKVVKVMKDNPKYKLHISGHTDNVGNPEKNMKLSKERAASVVKYLTKKGVKASRLRSSGFGDTKPVASNKTEKGKKQNRRVDFEVEF